MFSLKLTADPAHYDEYGQPCYPVGQEKGLIEFQENRLIKQALADGYTASGDDCRLVCDHLIARTLNGLNKTRAQSAALAHDNERRAVITLGLHRRHPKLCTHSRKTPLLGFCQKYASDSARVSGYSETEATAFHPCPSRTFRFESECRQ